MYMPPWQTSEIAKRLTPSKQIVFIVGACAVQHRWDQGCQNQGMHSRVGLKFCYEIIESALQSISLLAEF